MDESFTNISFMLASILTLILVNRNNHFLLEDDDDSSVESNEATLSENIGYVCEEQDTRRMEIYSTLLMNMEDKRDMVFEKMPTFNEMLSGRRRCYSADDIDALMLIPDQRIKSVFDEALKDLLELQRSESECKSACGSTIVSRVSQGTISSWDNMED